MIKLSVNETKWSSLLARTRALILYISIWIFDFGPIKLPGLSRNGPLDTTPYVSWICLLMVILSLDVRVYFLDTLPNNKHFQIAIRSGMVDEEPESGCSTSKYLFIYLFIYSSIFYDTQRRWLPPPSFFVAINSVSISSAINVSF